MNGGTTNETLEQHLLFHKALIDDNVASEKIDRYLNILNEAPDCERMQDPVDESIRTVFRLVLEQDFDPWSIDLREFVRTYTAKVNSHNKFDIIVAGKLILMAWKVLRMQTDATKMESDRNDAMFEFEEIEEEIMDCEPTLYVPGITLRETYARTPQRPVTMMELLDAFEEAREEIIASVERERVRQELKAKEPKVFDNKAHKDGMPGADLYDILNGQGVTAMLGAHYHYPRFMPPNEIVDYPVFVGGEAAITKSTVMRCDMDDESIRVRIIDHNGDAIADWRSAPHAAQSAR